MHFFPHLSGRWGWCRPVRLLPADPLIMGYIDANRTKMMTDLQDMTLSVAAIVRINFITSFYSLFLPGVPRGGWDPLAPARPA